MAVRFRPKLERLDPNAYYAAAYLALRYDVHPVTIWKWVSRGILPRPTRLGPNCSRWLGSVIEARERQQSAEE